MRNDLRRLHATLDQMETARAAPPLTSAERRNRMLEIERDVVEPRWVAKYGRPPTDDEVHTHQRAVLLVLAAQADAAGRSDWAADFRRFAEMRRLSWRETLARDVEAEDPEWAARLRATDAVEREAEAERNACRADECPMCNHPAARSLVRPGRPDEATASIGTIDDE